MTESYHWSFKDIPRSVRAVAGLARVALAEIIAGVDTRNADRLNGPEDE